MQFIPIAIRGPLFMILSTGSYVVNDTMMKLATVGLPPYEVLFLRGAAATLWGIPLLLSLGYAKQIRLILDRRVLQRNLLELAAILCYVVALANMQIADSTALGQITPLLMLIGSSVLFRERIGGLRTALIGLGFIGAVMVAQPTMQGISVYALLALGNAAFAAARDLAGRRVAADVPGMIVAISAVVVVLVGSGAAHLMSERWVMPETHHLLLMAGAGLFLISAASSSSWPTASGRPASWRRSITASPSGRSSPAWWCSSNCQTRWRSAVSCWWWPAG